jgi:flagellar biosynthesis/type III secretory pathway M-ring protein FliF/YscJ
MSWQKDTDDLVRGTFLGSAIFWIILGTVVAAVMALTMLRPWMLDQERIQNESSQQYVETYQARLIDLKADYDKIEVQKAQSPSIATVLSGQQISVLDQMVEARAKIKPDQVPLVVQKFLAEKGR